MAFFINLGLSPGPGVKTYSFKMQKVYTITTAQDKEGTVEDKKYLY